MQRHMQKTDDHFAWAETKSRVTLEGRLILNRVLDQVLVELNTEMLAALNEGRIIDIDIDRAEIKRRLLATAKKELGSGR